MDLIKKAWEVGIPVLGICRGAQLLCAMTGGKLYQDVSGHAGGNHPIYSKFKGWEFGETNSCHHQMMIPTEEGELLAWNDPLSRWKKAQGPEYNFEQIIREAGLSGRVTRFKVEKRVVEDIKEPEVVLWKERRSLGVQGHPEWLRPHDWLVRFTQHILNDLGVA
jgi:gamma-glutamyl-gamma-aminobutyrate hydrolase PuuD